LAHLRRTAIVSNEHSPDSQPYLFQPLNMHW
jgi:hypothetical protein